MDVSAVSPQTAQRVVDLMSGAIYAIDGNMGELTKDVYVFTPRGVAANTLAGYSDYKLRIESQREVGQPTSRGFYIHMPCSS